MAIETRALRKIYAAPKLKKRRSGGPAMPGPPAPPVARPTGGGSIVALDGLDLEVPAGEFFGLLGPNGAGKTTTIGILTTRVLPTGGQALVAGADVVARRGRRAPAHRRRAAAARTPTAASRRSRT